jgi:hypothetical protein
MKRAPKRRTRSGISPELRAIYAEAKRAGIWIREWAGGLAAAGPMARIRRLEGELRREIDIEKLSLGEIVQRGLAEPGGGTTREEACRNAVGACKKRFTVRGRLE